jgi:ABC-2 type transport system permease protein
MPIFDQGYQHHEGQLSGHAWRWLTITRQGVRAGLKSLLVRVLLVIAWLPAFALAGVLVVWGLFEQKASFIMPLVQIFQLPPEIQAGPTEFRMVVWRLAYYYFFQIELFFSMLVVLLIGPGLISQDLRFNALPLYFSRPLRRIDYFLGKLGVIGVFVGAVAVLPAVISYVLGVAFSLDLNIVGETIGLLLGSVLSGLIVVVSSGTLMLALSALSRNSRYVMAMWLGFWMLTGICSLVMQGIITAEYHMRMNRERRQYQMALRRGERQTPPERPARPADWYRALSLTDNQLRFSKLLLNTDAAWDKVATLVPRSGRDELDELRGPRFPWYWSAGILLGLCGISTCILSRRVKSLDRLR